MNKKALIGKLIFLMAHAILVMGALIYLTFSEKGFGFKTGEVTINIDYEPNKGKIVEAESVYNETNMTENNNTLINTSIP